jgi:protein phosphatase
MNATTNDAARLARRRALSPLLEREGFKPLSSTVDVEFGVRSCAGPGRTENEDHYLIWRFARSQQTLATSLARIEVPEQFDEAGYAMLVADGLGGAGTGGVAGRIVLSTLVHLALHFGRWNVRVDDRTSMEIIKRIEWCYERADEIVSRTARDVPALEGMATTLTAAYAAGDDLFLAHVGHSRAYLFRHGQLRLLTTPSSARLTQPIAPVEMGVPPSDADLSDMLADTIGGPLGAAQVQVTHERLLSGDSLLLCTDGLTNYVDDELIAEILAPRRRLDDKCQVLLDQALARGGTDNVTAVLAQFQIPAGSA